MNAIDCEKPGDCAYPGCDCPEDDDPFDECDHENADFDILTGRMHCTCCVTGWWATDAEMKRYHELMARPYPDDETNG